jgi:sulfatase modifying factor 1
VSLHLRFLSGSALRKIVCLLVAFCVPPVANAVDIEWVGIGDARNPADTAVMVTDGTTGYGSVRYDFEIGTVEVTNSQYVEFLNSVVSCRPDVNGLYNPEMEADVLNGGVLMGSESCVVGNPGNAPDVNGLGSVADVYSIRPHETTNEEYAELLNAVAVEDDPNALYSLEMETSVEGGIVRSGEEGSYQYTVKDGFDLKPVNFVSFWDAARYINWLANGRPTGGQTLATTENGSYLLEYKETPNPVTRNSVVRNPGATVFVPSRDEAYKAAYYDPNSQAYFMYPAASSDEITCTDPSDTPNTANCVGGPAGVTDTGSYTESSSPYGTFDQGGNVDEWTESLVAAFGVFYRISLGGSFADPALSLAAPVGTPNFPVTELATRGFRVARVEVRYQPKPDFEEKPVNYVSFWNALRFVNWLENGQPVGAPGPLTTEDGGYTLTEEGIAANTITRNWSSRLFMTSEDEWYKAAYYDASAQSYFTYPTADGAELDCEVPTFDPEEDPAVPDTANCGDAVLVLNGAIFEAVSTAVRAYPASPSSYGTLDQGGNLFEWNDTIVATDSRGMRGGFYGASNFSTESVARGLNVPAIEAPSVGFRVTQIPEPASWLLQGFMLATLVVLRRRSDRCSSARLNSIRST